MMSEGIHYRGWIVVLGVFVLVFFAMGSLYSFGAFFKHLSQDFRANRADISFAFALASSLTLAVGALSGPVADRLGPRPLIGFGALLCAGGLWAASMANSLGQIYASYALGLGLGTGCFYVPSLGAVQRWFVRRRAFASGIAVSGIGAGTLLLPRVAASLIQAHGWRTTYQVFAVAMLLAGVVGIFCVKHSPERNADRREGLSGTIQQQPASGLTLGEAARTQTFWLLYGASFASTLGLFVPFVHLTPYALDHGLATSFSVTLIGLIGVGSLAGRLTLGSLADRLGRKTSVVLSFIGMAIATFAWLGGPYPVLLGAVALTFGVFYGGFVALMPSVVMDCFGGRSVSTILGMLYTGAGIAALFGPPLAGYAFDRTGSYTAAIAGAALANSMAAVLARFARLPKPLSA